MHPGRKNVHRAAVVATLVTLLPLASHGQDQPEAKSRITALTVAEATSILDGSQDKRELEQAAIFLARSKDPTALDALADRLLDTSLLQKLDMDKDYRYDRSRLRITRILREIGRVGTPDAERALLKLAADEAFASRKPGRTPGYERLFLVIRAFGELSHIGPAGLSFLDTELTASRTRGTAARSALARVGSPETCRLLEKHMFSGIFDSDWTIRLLKSELITVRDKPAVVELYRRLMKRRIRDDKLRNMIVLTLFDYRRLEWWGMLHYCPKPPPREEAPPESLRKLLKCADMALSLRVPESTKERVRLAKNEIKHIMERGHVTLEDSVNLLLLRTPPEERPTVVYEDAKLKDTAVSSADFIDEGQGLLFSSPYHARKLAKYKLTFKVSEGKLVISTRAKDVQENRKGYSGDSQ